MSYAPGKVVAAALLGTFAASCDSSSLHPQPGPDGAADGAGPGGSLGSGGSFGFGSMSGPGGAGGGSGVAPRPSFPDAAAPADALIAGDAGAASLRSLCELGCRNAFTLGCANASTCVAECESSLTLFDQNPQCRSTLEALLTCAATRPLPDWQCGADGTLTVRDGVCEAEAQAAVMCLGGGAGGSGGASGTPDAAAPPRGDAGAVVVGDGGAASLQWLCELGCRNAFTLQCPKASSCAADCQEDLKFLDQKPQCRPAVESLLMCAASRPLQDWSCDADGSLQVKDGVCQAEGQAAVSCILGP